MIKSVSSILCLTFVVGLAGCASADKVALMEPVGPSMAMPGKSVQEGYLQVFSAFEPASGNVFLEAMIQNNDFGRNEFLRSATRTGYALYGEDGALLRRVDNSGGETDAVPAVVALPPGIYRVEASALHQKAVSVPVAIAPGQATLVHLDGKWQAPRSAPGAEIVSLPHGVQVGWRASVSSSEASRVRERVEE